RARGDTARRGARHARLRVRHRRESECLSIAQPVRAARQEAVMSRWFSRALLVSLATGSVHGFTQQAPQTASDVNAYYQLGPDSKSRDGVPKGVMHGPFVLPSQVYPGTQHTYWIYVPAQYDPAVSASLMIFQDGQAFKDMTGTIRAPNVL